MYHLSLVPSKVTAIRKVVPVLQMETLQSTKGNIGKTVDSETLRIGVHTISADFNSDDEQLKKIEAICEHNANVCEDLGEIPKMGTWRLVSKVVRSKRNRTGRGFDGWGEALGGNLIGSLLTFYESRGDVQMLSSLVCVLRDNGQCITNENKRREWSFLPKDQNAKYDLYIRCYSELLYGWGLLTTRAELGKHLTQSILLEEVNNDEGMGGLAFDIECRQCSGNTHSGYCRSCNDFSFRCSICDNAVRGLFTVCITYVTVLQLITILLHCMQQLTPYLCFVAYDSCGHGGHVAHITEWFKRNNKCPTGCGCMCKLSTSTLEK